MAKSQKRSNREAKKPKAIKAPVEAAASIGIIGKQAPARPFGDTRKR